MAEDFPDEAMPTIPNVKQATACLRLCLSEG